MQKFLIVGLGNKGVAYEQTRHNVGFKVVDQLVESLGISFENTNFGAIAKTRVKGREILLLKPDTYMNLSGNAVRFWLKKERIPLSNLLIITDDLHLPFGVLRLKGKGSHAGHNGLKNIEEQLETNQYARLKFGIGADFSKGKQVDFVLNTWNEQENVDLPLRLKIFADAILDFVLSGLQRAMTNFNGK